MADKSESAAAAAEKAYEEAAASAAAPKPEPAPAVKLAAEPAPMAPAKPAAPAKKPASTVKKASPARKAKTPKASSPKAPAKAVAKKKVPTAPKPAKAPAKAVSPKPQIVANLKETIMATATKSGYTKMLSDAFGTVKEKAQTAYEKGSALASEMGDITKGNLEAFVESSKVLASGMQELGREYVEESKGAFETATADLKKAAALKSPTELYELQGELMRRNFDAAIAFGSKSSEKLVKLTNEAFTPLSSRFSIIAEKASKIA